jgi:D-amino peptidase
VVFLSGDQTICEDARKLLGPIETAAVKDATGFYSASMMHPEEAQKLIREGVRRGVERRRELKPYRVARPVRLQLRFHNVVDAEVISLLPGVERPFGNVVVFQGRDMVEVARFLEAIGNMNQVEP